MYRAEYEDAGAAGMTGVIRGLTAYGARHTAYGSRRLSGSRLRATGLGLSHRMHPMHPAPTDLVHPMSPMPLMHLVPA